jgi:SAM-dependent methyltransferase
MTRREKILPWINTNGVGLEIGPGPYPVLPKSGGYSVEIVDCEPREKLLEKFRAYKSSHSIEEVDHLWSGQTYAELTGKTNHYDWIVACHVIEHTPDLIAFLKDCETVLNERGVLALVVPDKRYCFDHFRPLTGLARIVDSHANQNRIHSEGTAAEYFMQVVSRGKQNDWPGFSLGQFAFIHTPQEAIHAIRAIREERQFLDLHAWCFVPSSFRLLMHDLYLLGYTRLQELAFYQTEDCEFTLLLGKEGKGPQVSRLELNQRIQQECREPWVLQKLWWRVYTKLKNLSCRMGNIFRRK